MNVLLFLKKKKLKQNNNLNYGWLVYKNNYSDVISCNELAYSISVSKIGINSLAYDFNYNEIKWNVSGLSLINIMRFKFKIHEIFIGAILSRPCKNTDVIKLEFYFIDKNGEKITKSPLI